MRTGLSTRGSLEPQRFSGAVANLPVTAVDLADFDRLPAPALPPPIVALYQWQPSIRPKAVVDAELHAGDGLLDVNPWHNFGDTKNRSGQC
jgi:hypothetical protein